MTNASNGIELVVEILQYLHYYRDRSTLLSTALVSKDWSVLSQRILFSVVDDYGIDNDENRDRIRSMHMRFLRTITEYPQRLGPLVRSYAQDCVTFNPAASVLGRVEPVYELWTLTEKALPLMVNLKHLYLDPEIDRWPARDDWLSSRVLLKHFAFQLETLSWRSYFHSQNGILEFLRTQKHLTHLETGRYPSDVHLSWLEDGVCPNLMSISGGFDCLIHVARSRKVVAWKWYPDDKIVGEVAARSSSALDSLKYLSVSKYKSFRDIVGPFDLKIDLLELELARVWDLRMLAHLANMPSLRVLGIMQGTYCQIPDESIARGAVDCFKRFPNLEYIIRRSFSVHGTDYRYVKLSPSQISTEEVLQEELNIYYDIGAPWWTLYDV